MLVFRSASFLSRQIRRCTTSSSSSSSSSSSALPQSFSLSQKNYQGKPYKVDLTKNAKWICCCGQSNKYPLCDGSHKNYNNGVIKPFKADIEELKKDVISICGCGYTQSTSSGTHFCDGTHRKLQTASSK